VTIKKKKGQVSYQQRLKNVLT